MKPLTDHFGLPLGVGDKVAYATFGDRGLARIVDGTITEIGEKTVTIEREVTLPGYDKETMRPRTAMRPYAYSRGRPLFKDTRS